MGHGFEREFFAFWNRSTSANEDDDLSKVDAEPEAEVASPLQRRPETPATFNTINGDGDGEDSEPEVSHPASFVIIFHIFSYRFRWLAACLHTLRMAFGVCNLIN